MAGLDKEFTGEAWAADGVRMGYLPQEPQLDPTKDVRGNVMEGVAAKQALVDRYNEIAANYSDETADEMAKLQDEIEAQGPVGSRQPGRSGDGRAALPRWRCQCGDTVRRREAAASRSASCCSMRPTFCCSTNRPTIWTRNRWPGSNTRCANTRAASSWSPMTATSSTMSRAGFWNSTAARAFRMKAITPPSSSCRKSACKQEGNEEAARERTIAREREWIAQSPRRARPSPRRASTPMKNCSPRSQEQRGRHGADRHPGGRASGLAGGREPKASPRAMATGCCSRT